MFKVYLKRFLEPEYMAIGIVYLAGIIVGCVISLSLQATAILFLVLSVYYSFSLLKNMYDYRQLDIKLKQLERQLEQLNETKVVNV